MNARTHRLDLVVEGHQVEEALQALFHALLLHRSTGKFSYKVGGKYSIGTIGVEDIDCERINLTYVRVSSYGLQQRLRAELRQFCDALRACEMNSYNEPVTGEIELQFYQKKKATWPFADECIPWEVWCISVNVISLSNENERQIFSQKLSEAMCENMLTIAEVMNSPDLYTPKVPTQQELDCIYDTSLCDVQPYLHKMAYQVNNGSFNQGSVGATMKKIIKGTLALN